MAKCDNKTNSTKYCKMLSGEPWTIAMFDHFRYYILAEVKDSAVLDPENEAPTFQKAKFEETGNWIKSGMDYEDGKRVFEL